MIFYLLLCNILFIPIIYSKNITISKLEIANKTVIESHEIYLPNKTKEKLLSEGGELLPDTSILALPKDKHAILMSLDSETSKNKVKSVVARKGVVYTEDNTEKPSQKGLSTIGESSTVTSNLTEKVDTLKEQVNNGTNTVDLTKVNNTLVNKINSTKDLNETEIPRKPHILSYDKVVNMTVKTPSAKTVDQISSHTKELKAYAKNANSHPGMIMPLVITILLVPMFAVLGYMALRRGQEAWKNRHYKRMDFLLDGMYND